MNLLSLLLALLIVLPAIAFATWTWFTMMQIEADLLEFDSGRDLAGGFDLAAARA